MTDGGGGWMSGAALRPEQINNNPLIIALSNILCGAVYGLLTRCGETKGAQLAWMGVLQMKKKIALPSAIYFADVV
jgi:hypothetical protein